MTIFEGSAVALVLPMFDNGDIDFEGFKRQVQRMIDGGVQALLVNGTTLFLSFCKRNYAECTSSESTNAFFANM